MEPLALKGSIDPSNKHVEIVVRFEESKYHNKVFEQLHRTIFGYPVDPATDWWGMRLWLLGVDCSQPSGLLSITQRKPSSLQHYPRLNTYHRNEGKSDIPIITVVYCSKKWRYAAKLWFKAAGNVCSGDRSYSSRKTCTDLSYRCFKCFRTE